MAATRKWLIPCLLVAGGAAILSSAFAPASRGADSWPGSASLSPPSRARVAPAATPQIARGPAPAPLTLAPSPPTGTLAERRLARAELTLQSYLDATRYPPDARPLRERSDQERPHHVPSRRLPLARADRRLTVAQVTLRQDRHYVSGTERVALSIACADTEGPIACDVLSATASIPPDRPDAAAFAPVPVRFAPEPGAGAGVFTADFQPARDGFADHHGPIRVDLQVRADAEEGGASFDVDYTPEPPAIFMGEVRDSLIDGSVALDIALRVERPGRYRIRARADDAGGRPFALLSFDGDLAAGDQAARLRLFGKLILDEAARSPFRIRDLEGFRFDEQGYPDRETIPALDGLVHTTRRYADRDLSSEAWESADKARRVERLRAEARRAAEGLAPAARTD